MSQNEKEQPAVSVPSTPPGDKSKPAEIGGRKGPEPTRYGDWENGGKCVDF